MAGLHLAWVVCATPVVIVGEPVEVFGRERCTARQLWSSAPGIGATVGWILIPNPLFENARCSTVGVHTAIPGSRETVSDATTGVRIASRPAVTTAIAVALTVARARSAARSVACFCRRT